VSAQQTPGPWRWELSQKSKRLHLVGGRPMYDLTIIEPTRWGMGSATLMIRDTAHDGMNIMHKLHERPDWIAPFPGRAHHASWCADVIHPDMQLIAAAPELLSALRWAMGWVPPPVPFPTLAHDEYATHHRNACAAIARATGKAP
jgi:hypothetical protein